MDVRLVQTVQKYIVSNTLLVPDKTIIVGLSGGADSVALLHVLSRLGYDCVAAHCNFHLRGKESDHDELFAETYALQQGVRIEKIHFQTKEYARMHKLSIEMAARELRYEWFEKLRRRYQAQAIAVAHHRDDNVETLLLNLIRGSGIRGLSGIHSHNGYIVRPFLEVSRAEILEYIQDEKLTYVTDSTNLSDAYTRNFIRLNILPLLEKLNPSVRKAIARTAHHLSDTESVFLYTVKQLRQKIWVAPNKLSITALMQSPAPKTILYELLSPYGFGRTTTEDLFQSLGGESGKVFYSATHRIVKDRIFLLLTENKMTDTLVYTVSPVQNEISFPIQLRFEIQDVDADYQIEKSKKTACLDYDKLVFPLIIRSWEAGDWFVPFGMKGRQKLSDYFSDHKFSRVKKEKIWLLCSGNDIVWIIGERTDNRYRIDATTQKAFVVKFFDEIS